MVSPENRQEALAQLATLFPKKCAGLKAEIGRQEGEIRHSKKMMDLLTQGDKNTRSIDRKQIDETEKIVSPLKEWLTNMTVDPAWAANNLTGEAKPGKLFRISDQPTILERVDGDQATVTVDVAIAC